MNMNESDFENELRALRPTAPSTRLEREIAAELGSPERFELIPVAGTPVCRVDLRSLLTGWLKWPLIGSVAAVIALFAAWDRDPTSRSAPSTPVPISQAAPAVLSHALESSCELLEAAEEGVVFSPDHEPARQLRFTYVERWAWTNPATGARIEVEMPREDTFLMPIAMQ